jgi:hypothetical protein
LAFVGTLVQACISSTTPSATREVGNPGDGALGDLGVIHLAICAAMSPVAKPREYNDNTTASMLDNHRFRSATITARSCIRILRHLNGYLTRVGQHHFGALPG